MASLINLVEWNKSKESHLHRISARYFITSCNLVTVLVHRNHSSCLLFLEIWKHGMRLCIYHLAVFGKVKITSSHHWILNDWLTKRRTRWLCFFCMHLRIGKEDILFSLIIPESVFTKDCFLADFFVANCKMIRRI